MWLKLTIVAVKGCQGGVFLRAHVLFVVVALCSTLAGCRTTIKSVICDCKVGLDSNGNCLVIDSAITDRLESILVYGRLETNLDYVDGPWSVRWYLSKPAVIDSMVTSSETGEFEFVSFSAIDSIRLYHWGTSVTIRTDFFRKGMAYGVSYCINHEVLP